MKKWKGLTVWDLLSHEATIKTGNSLHKMANIKRIKFQYMEEKSRSQKRP